VARREDDAIRTGCGGRGGSDPLARVEGRGALVQVEQGESLAGRIHRR